MKRKVVEWTPEMLKRFQVSYTKAVEEKAKTFIFDGNEYVVDYAKYLIEYLTSEFKKS